MPEYGLDQLTDSLRTVRANTIRVAEDIPEPEYHYRPAPGRRVSPWPEPVHSALVLPIALRGEERPYGALVAGLSPRLAFDDGDRGYLDLVAGQVATAITSHRLGRRHPPRQAGLDIRSVRAGAS